MSFTGLLITVFILWLIFGGQSQNPGSSGSYRYRRGSSGTSKPKPPPCPPPKTLRSHDNDTRDQFGQH